MPTWNELIDEACEVLAAADVPDPSGSVRWIGRQATGADAEDWAEVSTRQATTRQLASFDHMVERRAAGEPLQYVVGSWGFRTLDLMVDRRVLIPRPETETIAGRAIDEIDRLASRHDRPLVAADLGTGSGAIGLSLAAERPGTEVWLTDRSDDALAVARANLAGLGRHGGTVRLAAGDWFAALPDHLLGRVDVVVSNPPYVASLHDLEPSVSAWEPHEALLAAEDGLAHLRHLIDRAPHWLEGHGSLILEFSPEQAGAVTRLAELRFGEVAVVHDLAGRVRGVVASEPSSAS